MLKNFGVGPQLILAFIFVSVVSISIQLAITSRSVSRSSTESALELLDEIGANYSGELNSFFERGFQVAADGKAVLYAARQYALESQTSPNRDMVISSFKALAAENPWQIGLWSAWEANAFDGLDAQFVNKPGHDQSGRLVFAVNPNSQGQIELSPLVGYNSDIEGAYYQLARKTGRPVILEPYEYEITGRKMLLTTMTIPYAEKGQVIGSAGVDISLEQITKMISSIKPMDEGQAILISPGGMIVAHSDPALVGRAFADTPRGRLVGADVDQIQSGGGHIVKVIKDGWISGQEDAAASIYAFSPGQSGGNWAFISLVPMSRVLVTSKTLVNDGLLVGAGVLALSIIIGLLAVKLIVGGLTRRIMNVVMDLDDISNGINSESREISDSSHNISAGAENQAASLEETAAALEEISSMTKKTLENSQNADNGAKETKSLVEGGVEDMRSMNMAMAEIEDSASKINNIIKAIEEIAFQTNLLALNASVEAARAGEAGAGFAVVADEVRNLAIRSAESVNNTKSLIDLTISRVKNGSKVAERLDASFSKIESSSKNIEELVAEIFEAASSQDVGIDQVNQAVVVLNNITNENVNAVSALANAATQLSGETDKMAQVVELLLATVGGKR